MASFAVPWKGAGSPPRAPTCDRDTSPRSRRCRAHLPPGRSRMNGTTCAHRRHPQAGHEHGVVNGMQGQRRHDLRFPVTVHGTGSSPPHLCTPRPRTGPSSRCSSPFLSCHSAPSSVIVPPYSTFHRVSLPRRRSHGPPAVKERRFSPDPQIKAGPPGAANTERPLDLHFA